MTDCTNTEARDALPDLLHGRLGDLDKTTMKAHVESCADCRAEIALMERVRAFAPLTPSIDVSRIVSMLPAPLPSAEKQLVYTAPGRQSSRMSMLWKLAAASALIVAGALTFAKANAPGLAGSSVAAMTRAPSAVSEIAAPTVKAELAAKEVAIASTLPEGTAKKAVASATSGLSLTGGLQDLTDAQLEALLKDVDNVDGLPAAEPEVISVSVESHEGLQ